MENDEKLIENIKNFINKYKKQLNNIGDGFHIELSEDVFWLVDNCSNDGDYGYESNGIIEVKYIHELQHILRLCKIGKEIIL